MTGFRFELTVAQSYAAATEAMCTGAAEIGWFGAVSYLQTKSRGCAELLAVDVVHGESVYYSGFFARRDSPVKRIRRTSRQRPRRLQFPSRHSNSYSNW